MSTTRTGLIKEIPLSRLKASAANARRTDTGLGIEELAASIAAHGLLQMPVVTPELDGEGQETGFFNVTAGERRRKALLRLVKDKKLRKSEPIACLVRADGEPAELSLAENSVRLTMHPADQVEAFARLHQEQGLGLEDIAARFGISPSVVRQRLRLAAVSPALMARYRAGELGLDQLMAFAITDDHAAQEAAFEQLSWNKSPEMIRRALTSRHVSSGDRRAVLVGLEAYEAAGGTVLRDLFTEDHGGWLADSALLDRLARERLEATAETVRQEGWKWVEAHLDHPHAQAAACQRVYPQPVPLSCDDQARLDALTARYDTLAAAHGDEPSEEAQAEIAALDAEIGTLRQREAAYDPEDVARSGVIVSLGTDGAPRIERGLVRPEDRPKAEETSPARPRGNGAAAEEPGTSSEGDSPRPLSEALLADLTAQRTAALQACLADRPDVALLALTHAMVLRTFGGDRWNPESCLGITLEVPRLEGPAPGIGGTKAAEVMARRHEDWAQKLPEPEALWDWLLAQEPETRLSLLACCVARTVDAVARPSRGQALRHADQLAGAIGLDMTAWWEATRESYLARVPKTRILEAVRDGVSEKDAESIDGLKKEAMAEQAERLLAGKGWLPEVLRTPAATPATAAAEIKTAAE